MGRSDRRERGETELGLERLTPSSPFSGQTTAPFPPGSEGHQLVWGCAPRSGPGSYWLPACLPQNEVIEILIELLKVGRNREQVGDTRISELKILLYNSTQSKAISRNC